MSVALEFYTLSIEINTKFISFPSIDLCLKCEPHYINVMKIRQLYGCYSVNEVESITGMVLPVSLKN